MSLLARPRKSCTRQILRVGYYWMTLENDCINYVRKCHKCQIYANKIHVPLTSLNVMVSPWPFSMWGMDVIRPITPKASNNHRFCRRSILSGLLFVLTLRWTLGPFMSRFEFGPRTYYIMWFIYFIESLSHFVLYLIITCVKCRSY